MEFMALDVVCNDKLGGFKLIEKWVTCHIHEAL
jgi:hypothetical protein